MPTIHFPVQIRIRMWRRPGRYTICFAQNGSQGCAPCRGWSSLRTMASSSGTPSLERVISEAFCAAAKVILESRIYASTPRTHQEQAKGRAWVSSRSSVQFARPASAFTSPPARSLQFNLEVEEVEGASKALERWRREAGLPLVLEVRKGDSERPAMQCTVRGCRCRRQHSPAEQKSRCRPPPLAPAGLPATLGRRAWRTAGQGCAAAGW